MFVPPPPLGPKRLYTQQNNSPLRPRGPQTKLHLVTVACFCFVSVLCARVCVTGVKKNELCSRIKRAPVPVLKTNEWIQRHGAGDEDGPKFCPSGEPSTASTRDALPRTRGGRRAFTWNPRRGPHLDVEVLKAELALNFGKHLAG